MRQCDLKVNNYIHGILNLTPQTYADSDLLRYILGKQWGKKVDLLCNVLGKKAEYYEVRSKSCRTDSITRKHEAVQTPVDG